MWGLVGAIGGVWIHSQPFQKGRGKTELRWAFQIQMARVAIIRSVGGGSLVGRSHRKKQADMVGRGHFATQDSCLHLLFLFLCGGLLTVIPTLQGPQPQGQAASKAEQHFQGRRVGIGCGSLIP